MLSSKYLNILELKNNLKVSIYDNHENIVNDKEETRILLRLVVKVGSLYENEKIF